MKSGDELACYFIDNLEVLGGQSIDQQTPILTSSILLPEVPPNSDNLFSTPVREATANPAKIITNYRGLTFNSEFQCQ